MKTKILVLTAALIGVASLSAQAGVYFSFRLPFPPVPVVVVRPPVPAIVTAPVTPVVYTPPAVVTESATPVECTPPAVDAAPVAVVAPPCPAPGYVWVPGYWSGRVWMGGYWHPGPRVVVYTHHGYGWRHW